MNFDLDILRIISNDVKPCTGKIIISEPLLNDSYFSRSVVCLIDDDKDSFMGLVLNKPSDVKLRDVLEGFEHTDFNLFIGGPVEQDVLFFIHTVDGISQAENITPGLFFGGDLDEIRELSKIGKINKTNIRFFLGSSGWAPGQLDEEISFNSWLVTDCNSEFLFSNADEMWTESLQFVGDRYKIWRNFPLDPDWN